MPAPANPSQVSGPGPMSRRTDGGAAQALQTLPNAKYGENSQFQSLQQGAPLSASGASPVPGGLDMGALPQNPAAGNVVPFSAPTNRPSEPVTSGASLGPGPGTQALGINPQQAEQQDMGQLARNMPVYEFLANLPNASPSARLLVNLLRAST
jgi:hypothetical protein